MPDALKAGTDPLEETRGGVATAAGNQEVSLEEEAAELDLNRELLGNWRTGHVAEGPLQGGGSAGFQERDGRMAVSGAI